MLVLTDLNNDQHMLSASVTHYIELNGDHNIKAQIFPQKETVHLRYKPRINKRKEDET